MAWWQNFNDIALEDPKKAAATMLPNPMKAINPAPTLTPDPVEPKANFLEALNAFRDQQMSKIPGMFDQITKPLQTPEEASRTNLGLMAVNALGPRKSASDTFFTSHGPVYTGTPEDQLGRDQAALNSAVLAPVKSAAEKREMSIKAWDLMNKLDENLVKHESMAIINRLHGAQANELESMNNPASMTSKSAQKTLEATTLNALSTLNQVQDKLNPDVYNARKQQIGEYAKLIGSMNAKQAQAAQKAIEGINDDIKANAGLVVQEKHDQATEAMARAQLEAMSGHYNTQGAIDAAKAMRESNAAAQKEAAARNKFAIEGFPILPNKEPTPVDYKKVLEARAAYGSVMSDLSDLRKMYQDNGTSWQKWVGNGGEMQQKYMSLLGKVRQADKMGVFRVAEVPFFEQEFPSPSSIMATIREGKDTGDYGRRLDMVANHMHDTLATTARAAGYDDSGFRKAMGMPIMNAYGQMIQPAAEGGPPEAQSTSVAPNVGHGSSGAGGSYSGLPPDAEAAMRAILAAEMKKMGIKPQAPAPRRTQGRGSEPQKQVVRKFYSQSTDKTKLVYSDGSEDIVDGKQ